MEKPVNPELVPFVRKPPVTSSTEARLPVRLGLGAIGRHDPCFVQLYYAVEARRTSAMPLVLQFIAPTPSTGATTVACGYARVAADDCSQPVLYIDCNAPPPRSRRVQARVRRGQQAVDQPLSLAEAMRRGLPLGDALVSVRDAQNLLWARLDDSERPLLALGGDRLQTMLGALRAEHSVIVLDTPSTQAPEAAAVSRYCDGSVLVVTAGRSRQWDIELARSSLERLGGQTVGVVLNRERGILPRWLRH